MRMRLSALLMSLRHTHGDERGSNMAYSTLSLVRSGKILTPAAGLKTAYSTRSFSTFACKGDDEGEEGWGEVEERLFGVDVVDGG